ncbi:hypothetical protein [Paraburkholderia sp. HP33-1]|uniref:hypothetical protein n=1 Tax=Paraburkholderia sp. HP33-1 TaxID=2883243 RepID=UPI001F37FE49|nr:hypothetical protein [Paraburkholderia sp. HP33-1]
MPFRSNTRNRVTHRCICLVAAFGLSAAWIPECGADDAVPAATSQAVPSGASVDTETGTVSLIDQKNAIIVVTVPGHDDLSFDAKDHRDALDAVKVGDKVTTRYLEPYVTELSVAKGEPLTRLNRTVTLTQHISGAGKEEFQALRVFRGVAEVTGVDRKLNLLTVEDKAGTVHSVRVSRPELVKVMQSLKRHNHVQIAYESESTVVVTR